MTTPLDEDYRRLQLLSYDQPTEVTERFCFSEMSTLQMTTLLPGGQKIVTSRIDANTDSDEFLNERYLDEKTSATFKTIGDFNDFFLNNSDFYINDCTIEFENGMKIGSHDDGEVSIELLRDDTGQTVLDSILSKFDLNKMLIDRLRSKPGHYFAIDKQHNIISEFEDFDDYLKNGRHLEYLS